jgi:hypothetical protein
VDLQLNRSLTLTLLSYKSEPWIISVANCCFFVLVLNKMICRLILSVIPEFAKSINTANIICAEDKTNIKRYCA